MKRFTNKQQCLDWLVKSYEHASRAISDCGIAWVYLDLNEFICENSITEAFESKFTDLDSKQQLEQMVVDEFHNKINELAACERITENIGRYLNENERLTASSGVFKPSDFAKFDAVEKPNKYIRNLKGVECDVYDVLKAFDVACPALQHLIKKALCAGLRGHKDKTQDLKDILDSAKRAVELNDTEVE